VSDLSGASFCVSDFIKTNRPQGRSGWASLSDHLRRDLFLSGTFPPAALACDRPIAIACLRLVTFWPELLFSFPCFISCMARSTFVAAFCPYLAMGFSG